ncbi:MAG: L,D-transpeptidase [Alphaproteobacteria bacterium]|nr:MAG: L,D-transpeptidase [Alphaproteobacteria bacterium]
MGWSDIEVEGKKNRRRFLQLLAIAPLAVASGCATTTDREVAQYRWRWDYRRDRFRQPYFGGWRPSGEAPVTFDYDLIYAAMDDGGFRLPAIPWREIDRRFLRQRVADPTGLRPGTLVVDTSAHLLYLTEPGGSALRYGVGLGRAGFEWAGSGTVGRKQAWPRWHPPEEMIERQPELEKYRTTYDRQNDAWLGGMEPGLTNPLGSRAIYIHQNGRDTLYRIHGSPEWRSIGKSVSSGCVRMINQDVIDLFERVAVGTPILVTSGLPGRIS